MAIDFPSAPGNGQEHTSGGVTYVYNGTGWVMKPTPAVPAAPLDALACNGMQINGSMEVSQENGSNNVPIPNAALKYVIDGWIGYSNGVQSMTGVQQTTAGIMAPIPFMAGVQMIANGAANPSPGASDLAYFLQNIEGYRVARLGWGTANAQPVTAGFWVYAFRAGMYSAAVRNPSGARSYVFSFTVASSATWQWVAATIPGDVTGTWPKNNTTGMLFSIAMMAGATFQTAPGAWSAGNFAGATGMTNGVAATSDYMIVTGFVLLPGTQAPTAAQSPLIMRPYDQELDICKRYWEKSGTRSLTWSGHITAGTSAQIAVSSFKKEKRAVPTMVFTDVGMGGAGFTALPFATVLPSVSNVYVERVPSAAGYGFFFTTYTADARL